MQTDHSQNYDWIDLTLRLLHFAVRLGFYIFLAFCFLSVLIELDIFYTSDEEFQRAEEVRQWCAEYMPDASLGECSPDTAW